MWKFDLEQLCWNIFYFVGPYLHQFQYLCNVKLDLVEPIYKFLVNFLANEGYLPG